MKKLSKLKLKEFAVMNDSEMKSVVGGYDGGELPPVDDMGMGQTIAPIEASMI